jgi:osomolarity two-component system phosphorelay intermediate protein YPD1
LKGSSAALGLIKVRASCERIQFYGSLKDETGSSSISPEQALNLVTNALGQAKNEYQEAETYLKSFFNIA